jgi:hypothetical protein
VPIGAPIRLRYVPRNDSSENPAIAPPTIAPATPSKILSVRSDLESANRLKHHPPTVPMTICEAKITGWSANTAYVLPPSRGPMEKDARLGNEPRPKPRVSQKKGPRPDEQRVPFAKEHNKFNSVLHSPAIAFPFFQCHACSACCGRLINVKETCGRPGVRNSNMSFEGGA